MLLAFFQAVIGDTDAFHLVALPSCMWLPRFQGFIFIKLGQNGKSQRSTCGSGIWAGLGGAHITSNHIPLTET